MLFRQWNMSCTFTVVLIIIFIIIIISAFLPTGIFSRVLLLLIQRRSPPLSLQFSNCSTFNVLCDVLSTVVFCRESIECFPGVVCKFHFKLSVTNPLTPIITCLITYFTFDLCLNILLLLLYIPDITYNISP